MTSVSSSQLQTFSWLRPTTASSNGIQQYAAYLSNPSGDVAKIHSSFFFGEEKEFINELNYCSLVDANTLHFKRFFEPQEDRSRGKFSCLGFYPANDKRSNQPTVRMIYLRSWKDRVH